MSIFARAKGRTRGVEYCIPKPIEFAGEVPAEGRCGGTENPLLRSGRMTVPHAVRRGVDNHMEANGFFQAVDNPWGNLWAACGNAARLCTRFCCYPRLSKLSLSRLCRKLRVHAKALDRCRRHGEAGGDPRRTVREVPACGRGGFGRHGSTSEACARRVGDFGPSSAEPGQRQRLSLSCGSWGRGPIPSGFGSRHAPESRGGRQRTSGWTERPDPSVTANSQAGVCTQKAPATAPGADKFHPLSLLNDLCPGCVQRGSGAVLKRFCLHGAWPAPRGVRVRCLGGALAGFPGPASLTPLSLSKPRITDNNILRILDVSMNTSCV